MPIDDAVQLIKMEYGEMPDLKLTFSQVQRLWCLSSELCEQALTVLTASGFLFRTCDGLYIRHGESEPNIRAVAAVMRAMRAG